MKGLPGRDPELFCCLSDILPMASVMMSRSLLSPWQPWGTLVPLFPFFWPRQELHFLTPQYILLHRANSSRLLSALAFPVVVQTVWPF